jgi:hypothetical protein
MARKTVSIEKLVAMANAILADSAEDAVERRVGVMNLLEGMLHDAKAYSGFRYLNTGECAGKPGINRGPNMEHLEDYTARFADTDRTRVRYFD